MFPRDRHCSGACCGNQRYSDTETELTEPIGSTLHCFYFSIIIHCAATAAVSVVRHYRTLMQVLCQQNCRFSTSVFSTANACYIVSLILVCKLRAYNDQLQDNGAEATLS